jgi:hypothetical protein
MPRPGLPAESLVDHRRREGPQVHHRIRDRYQPGIGVLPPRRRLGDEPDDRLVAVARLVAGGPDRARRLACGGDRLASGPRTISITIRPRMATPARRTRPTPATAVLGVRGGWGVGSNPHASQARSPATAIQPHAGQYRSMKWSLGGRVVTRRPRPPPGRPGTDGRRVARMRETVPWCLSPPGAGREWRTRAPSSPRGRAIGLTGLPTLQSCQVVVPPWLSRGLMNLGRDVDQRCQAVSIRPLDRGRGHQSRRRRARCA